MRRRPKKKDEDDNGFAAWGGYMEAKKTKLAEQFNEVRSKQINKKSDIFNGVSILVNGYTKPGADELKFLMAMHGGCYHLYQNLAGKATTHIIASNLPNVKINQLGNVPVVSPNWIVDSIEANKLLDYKKYLLYTNHSRTQPKLNFAVVNKEESITKEESCSIIENQTFVECQPQQKYSKTASDPQFLSDFYNNSRLHLISTLGAEFKQLVNKLREESKGKFPGIEKLILMQNVENNKENILRNGSIIMHIDMDCFFVSVGLRNRPDLHGKPVAVTHSKGGKSNREGVDRQVEVDLYVKRLPDGATPKLNLIDNTSSMSEIASCSYEARKCGIKNGMFMGSALKLCPTLVPIPYDFQGYKDVSSILYHTIAEYTVNIEAVSCDEMYVDITKILQKTGLSVEEWATHIRNEITERTGCPCSTGFGANRLQARVATKKAKPNGQYYLQPENVENYMYELPLNELPGVGWATIIKLNNLGLKTCGDIYDVPLSTLKSELGQKNSESIYDQAKGIDRKPLCYEHERKSVSAEINYGIRFKNNDEALVFLESLSNEVYNRLMDIKMRSKSVPLKLLIRDEEAPKETAKYLGHGVCNVVNKSITTNYYLDSSQCIFKEIKNLYNKLKIVPEDLRGIGIQLAKLEKISSTNKALAKFLNQTSKRQNTVITTNVLDKDEKKDFNTKKVNNEKNINIGKSDSTNNAIIEDKIDRFNEQKINTSRRGRSRKNTSLTRNKSYTNLTTYFKNSKNDLTAVKEVSKGEKNKNAIDLNVLKELPKELQEEIIKEYNLPNAVLQNPKSESSLKTSETVSTAVKENSKRKQEIKSKKKGFADLSKEELKTLLKNWVNNENTPKDYDVDMLGTFLKSLVQERKIEYLFSIASLLHRHIAKRSCKWHEAYIKLLSHFQETMLLIYGNTLYVPQKFTCGFVHV